MTCQVSKQNVGGTTAGPGSQGFTMVFRGPQPSSVPTWASRPASGKAPPARSEPRVAHSHSPESSE